MEVTCPWGTTVGYKFDRCRTSATRQTEYSTLMSFPNVDVGEQESTFVAFHSLGGLYSSEEFTDKLIFIKFVAFILNLVTIFYLSVLNFGN